MGIDVTLQKRLRYFNIDISFSCGNSGMLVMIGPSGGGKTTIIRMLAGLEKPDSGRITFRNETWLDHSSGIDLATQKRKLGYVFQDYTLFPNLNLYENAAFAAVDTNDVDELFDLFKISHLKKQKPQNVSGGERQRCAICQAIARRPDVLLLDEPFSALDVITRRELREELKNLKGRFSFPVIYVTHDINEALFLADEILPVVNGSIDYSWMQRSVPRDQTLRAARETRLALVY